ncbi:MAG: GAF domain-containing protein [Chloroflexi bacterium]|nr:GAF domain-containing protein [Chloroflexota bacterium]
MGGEDLLTIVDHWSRSLSPPRTLLTRLLELAREADSNISDLRLLQHDNDILTPIAAAVSSEAGALRLDANPALAQAIREIRTTYLPPDCYAFPVVVDLECVPAHLLIVCSRTAMVSEVRAQLQFMARMIAQALELRDLRALSGFSHAMTALGEKAQEAISTRLHGTLSSLMGARDISQMAGIVARDLLSTREMLTLNELRYDESGVLTGWRPIPDNSGIANPRRELKLELAWLRVGEYLRQSIIKGEPFIANQLGPVERPLVGTPLFEWMQLNGIASAVFYPISHPTRTTAVMAVFTTVQRNVSEAAVQSFVKLTERMALLTQHNQHLSEVTVREYWATQMLRTSQHLLDAQEASDITRAAIDALPANVRLTALALFDVALKPGRWPDWLRVEALSSRVESRTLPVSADQPDQQDQAAQQMIIKLIEGKPILERLENGRLKLFAENLTQGLLDRGCTAVAYIGLVADDALHGLLVVGAAGVEALQPLGFVLRDMSSAVSQSVQRLMGQKRQIAPNDLSVLLEFGRELVRAGSNEELMFAVRRCLGEQFATVAWVDVVVNRITQRASEVKIALVLRGDRVEMMHDYPLHQDMDDEQNDLFRRTWLTRSRYGQVVHLESEAEMGNDPVLPIILKENDQIYSVVALPVLVDGQLTAQVYVAFQSAAHEATDEFKQLCCLIRDQLSLKVMSMRDTSTSKSDPNAPLLQVINDLAIRLLTVRDERMLLMEGARSFATALGVDHAGVTILREDESADVVAEYPEEGLIGLHIPADNPYLVRTIRDRVPLPVEDVRTDENLTLENREALAATGIRKMLFLPMLDQNQNCFGSIGLDVKREEYEFDLHMVEIARTLTNQLAMLYLSLRQVRIARRQAEQMVAMTGLTSQLVSAQRDDEVYLALADTIRTILPADDLWVLIDTAWLQGHSDWPMVDDAPVADDVQVVMQFEEGRPSRPAEPITFILENTPAGQARGDELVAVDDLQAHPDLRPLVSSRPARSVMAAPIKVNDKVVGVVEIDSHTPNVYTQSDRSLFAQVATQVSGALDRARTLQSSQRTAKTQEVAAVFANRVQSAGSQRETLVEAARGYQGLLSANQVNIQMGQPPDQPDPKPTGSSGAAGNNGAKGDKR